MRHDIQVEALETPVGPAITDMAGAVGACVHCGFCLATCPTYRVLGEETDSPRGRIVLMKEVLEGELALEEALPHIDPCLGCVACETSCPSGVEYGHLLQGFRAWAERERPGRARRFLRRLLLTTMMSPFRFQMAVTLAKFARPFRLLLPGPLRAALDLVPPAQGIKPEATNLPALKRSSMTPARPLRVALLRGCVQQVLAPEIERATVRVLESFGISVAVPSAQPCCGSLALHAGEEGLARVQASGMLRCFDSDELGPCDALITNAAGCGSGIQEYGGLFRGSPTEHRAAGLAAKSFDVTTFLVQHQLIARGALPQPLRVVYQDACHLRHAQKEHAAPRRLLAALKNVTLLEPRDAALCCGSAGIYNLEHPHLALELGRRKVNALLEQAPDVIVSGNIGCIIQLRQQLETHNQPETDRQVRVLHTVELLDYAYSGRSPLTTGQAS